MGNRGPQKTDSTRRGFLLWRYTEKQRKNKIGGTFFFFSRREMVSVI
jgi:hypothetical protein